MGSTEEELRQLEAAADAPADDLPTALAAADAAERLATLLRRLARKDAERYADRAARATRLLAFRFATVSMLCRYQNRSRDLVFYGRRAAKMLKAISGAEAEGTRARVLADLAFGYVEHGRYRAASRANRRAQKLLRTLSQSDPHQYLGVLADTYYTASGIAGLRGHRRAGLALAERAAELYQEAARLHPEANQLPYQRVLGSLLENLRAFGSRRALRRIQERHLSG